MKDLRSNSLRVAAENGELRRRVNVMKRKTLAAVSSAEQLQEKVNAMAEKRDALAAIYK